MQLLQNYQDEKLHTAWESKDLIDKLNQEGVKMNLLHEVTDRDLIDMEMHRHGSAWKHTTRNYYKILPSWTMKVN